MRDIFEPQEEYILVQFSHFFIGKSWWHNFICFVVFVDIVLTYDINIYIYIYIYTCNFRNLLKRAKKCVHVKSIIFRWLMSV